MPNALLGQPRHLRLSGACVESTVTIVANRGRISTLKSPPPRRNHSRAGYRSRRTQMANLAGIRRVADL
jgi:hypothetical protein